MMLLTVFRGYLTGLLIGTVVGAPLALAQEEGPRLLREMAGPYDVAVAISPAVPSFGAVHLSVTVLDASTGELVEDAQVRIGTQKPGDSPPGWAWALNSPASPGTYVADVNVETPGLWRLAVQVQSGLGKGTLDLSLEVPEVARSRGGTLIWAIMVGVFVFGFLRVWWISRGTRRRRQGSL